MSTAAFKGSSEVELSKNRIIRLFERFQLSVAPAEREDFFHGCNRDLYTREFARFLEEQIDPNFPSND